MRGIMMFGLVCMLALVIAEPAQAGCGKGGACDKGAAVGARVRGAGKCVLRVATAPVRLLCHR